MKAVLKDGTEIKCESYRTANSGLILFDDKDRDELAGFIPYDELRVVAPDDYEPKDRGEEVVSPNVDEPIDGSGTF